MSFERRVYGGTVVVLLVASLVAGATTGLGGGASTPSVNDTGEYEVTDAGVRYTVHPSTLRQGCPTGMDCIPSIDDPTFQSAGEASWLGPRDQVVGVEIDGEARAYPLRILTVHEIVNDRVAGAPIAVTYCPLCRSGLVFSREVGGETLSFGVSGKLLNANLVMYDRQTETYWSQLTGEAVVGPLVPGQLPIRPSAITSWEQWRDAHPDTQVLSRATGIYPRETYGSNPYGGYANSSRVGFGVDEVDDRLSPKTIVYGVTVGGHSQAYPESVVTAERVITDELGGVPLLVLNDPRDGSVDVYVREHDGRTYEFTREDGDLVSGNGTRWSFDGEALDGPGAGTQLDRIETHGIFWFAWSEFHPETDVYPGSDTR